MGRVGQNFLGAVAKLASDPAAPGRIGRGHPVLSLDPAAHAKNGGFLPFLDAGSSLVAGRLVAGLAQGLGNAGFSPRRLQMANYQTRPAHGLSAPPPRGTHTRSAGGASPFRRPGRTPDAGRAGEAWDLQNLPEGTDRRPCAAERYVRMPDGAKVSGSITGAGDAAQAEQPGSVGGAAEIHTNAAGRGENGAILSVEAGEAGRLGAPLSPVNGESE